MASVGFLTPYHVSRRHTIAFQYIHSTAEPRGRRVSGYAQSLEKAHRSDGQDPIALELQSETTRSKIGNRVDIPQ
jgi:hypothetical protein